MNKLSKEETFDLAYKGNSEAMVIVGGYYNKLATEGEYNDDYFQEAKKWYSLAAEKGNLIGAYRYILCLNFEAHTAMRIDFRGSKGNWELLLQKTVQLLDEINQKELDIKSIDFDLLIEKKNTSIYYLSVINYFSDNVSNACNLITQNDDDRSKLLYLLCQIQISLKKIQDENANKQDVIFFENIMKSLKEFVEQNEDYRQRKKAFQENIIYNMAVLSLCKYYSSKEQHDNAVNLLNLILSSNQNNESDNMLIEELSHYKKKIFGGYKYIE